MGARSSGLFFLADARAIVHRAKGLRRPVCGDGLGMGMQPERAMAGSTGPSPASSGYDPSRSTISSQPVKKLEEPIPRWQGPCLQQTGEERHPALSPATNPPSQPHGAGRSRPDGRAGPDAPLVAGHPGRSVLLCIDRQPASARSTAQASSWSPERPRPADGTQRNVTRAFLRCLARLRGLHLARCTSESRSEQRGSARREVALNASPDMRC